MLDGGGQSRADGADGLETGGLCTVRGPHGAGPGEAGREFTQSLRLSVLCSHAHALHGMQLSDT